MKSAQSVHPGAGVETAQGVRRPPVRQRGVYVDIPEDLNDAVRAEASARRVPIKAVHEAALRAYLKPAAQDNRDAMMVRHLNRFSRALNLITAGTCASKALRKR